MALSRRSGHRFQASIWPGFVDAMTALLLVLIFVLTIFMVVQSIQNETITGQESELDRLTDEIGQLTDVIGTERERNTELRQELENLGIALEDALDDDAFQARLIDTLTREIELRNTALDTAQERIDAFEARVATLLADRDAAEGQISRLQQDVDQARGQAADLETALAQARTELDAGAEAARLAAARREALEALVADLQRQSEDQQAALTLSDEQLAALQAELTQTRTALTEEETARLAEAAAAEALRERLRSADAELTAMTLSLEAQRQEAEETLTLLAAANAAREDLDQRLMAALLQGEDSAAALEAAQQALNEARERLNQEGQTQADLRDRLAEALLARQQSEADLQSALSAAEQRQALLATAQSTLSELEQTSAADQRRLAVLNAQVADLRNEMGRLQGLLDAADAKDAAADVQIENLGARLNTALARVASEQKRRAELEEAERQRLEAEAEDLARYRSEFFGRLREVLGDQEGVRVVGDRFVFSSEVLFASGSATLSPEGRVEIANVARLLQEVAAVIPPGINWVIRVDGHTDNVPISGGFYRDNWELSQARALSVVRFMIDNFGFPPERLAAAGFAEFQPVNPADTPEARAQNRRIELKLTER